MPTIDGFEIIEKIGEGGMATVWKATQISLDRVVAIKILLSKMEDDSADAERFQAEARAAAKLKHPGIVQVHDAGTERGHFYFVMEYIAGYTVGDWIRRKGRIPEDEALVVAECVVDALNYAWTTAGMIHCDIKPDNIIIDADGTVKVADLGLARTINTINAADMGDEVMGTPAYISPEQAEGKADLDCRSDIYALGAMLYHMLTGKLMFEGYDEEKVMELQVTTDPVDPKKLNPALSNGMRRLLASMLSKDPALRPADWNVMSGRLAKVHRDLEGKKAASQSGRQSAGREIRIDHDRLAKMASRQTPTAEKTAVPPTPWLIAGVAVIALLALIVVLRRPEAETSRPPVPVRRIHPEPQPVRPLAVVPDRARPATVRPLPPTRSSPGVAREAPPPSDTDAAEMLDFARYWASQHPDQIREAIRRFARVAEDTRGTKYALMAEEERQRLEEQLEHSTAGVMQQVGAQVKAAVESGDLLKGAEIYESYEGPLSLETRRERFVAANALRIRHRALRKDASFAQEKSKHRLDAALREVTDRILADGVDQTLKLCLAFEQDPQLMPDRDQIQALVGLLRQATYIDERILESFRRQKGDVVTVDLVQGERTVSIVDVRGDRVVAHQQLHTGAGTARSEVIFSPGDLSVRERMSRMGADTEPDVALLKGLMAYRAKSYRHARTFFEQVGPPLAERLLLRVEHAEHPEQADRNE